MKIFFFCFFMIFILAACNKDIEPKQTEKERFLNLVNEIRQKGCKCGNDQMPPAPSVSYNDKLFEAAQTHSNDMANNNFFSHTGSDGSSPGDRITRTGYKWATYGENIYLESGYGESPNSLENAFNSWLTSPGHCKNIMNPNFKEMGVALSYNKQRNETYVTQVFAASN